MIKINYIILVIFYALLFSCSTNEVGRYQIYSTGGAGVKNNIGPNEEEYVRGMVFLLDTKTGETSYLKGNDEWVKMKSK
jgi:hypothetical protein